MDTGLKNIQLPNFIVADFYKETLVVLEDVTIAPQKIEIPAATIAPTTTTPTPSPAPMPTKPVASTTAKWFLGDNKKGISILVNDETAVYLNDESLNFLSTILGACKLNLGDVAIINLANQAVNFATLKEKLQPQYYLLFSVTANQIELPFTVPHYQVQAYGGSSFLLAPSLQNMLGTGQEAKLEKSKLWLSLKKMFNI
jgi:hypothetical protein